MLFSTFSFEQPLHKGVVACRMNDIFEFFWRGEMFLCYNYFWFLGKVVYCNIFQILCMFQEFVRRFFEYISCNFRSFISSIFSFLIVFPFIVFWETWFKISLGWIVYIFGLKLVWTYFVSNITKNTSKKKIQKNYHG